MVFKVGDRVQARRNNNAAGEYFPARVTGITKVSPMAGSNWYGAEQNIMMQTFARMVTFGQLFKPTLYYDVTYDDGTFDKELPPRHVRALDDE